MLSKQPLRTQYVAEVSSSPLGAWSHGTSVNSSVSAQIPRTRIPFSCRRRTVRFQVVRPVVPWPIHCVAICTQQQRDFDCTGVPAARLHGGRGRLRTARACGWPPSAGARRPCPVGCLNDEGRPRYARANAGELTWRRSAGRFLVGPRTENQADNGIAGQPNVLERAQDVDVPTSRQHASCSWARPREEQLGLPAPRGAWPHTCRQARCASASRSQWRTWCGRPCRQCGRSRATGGRRSAS